MLKAERANAMRVASVLLVLVFAPLVKAELPNEPMTAMEGAFTRGLQLPTAASKPHIDAATWTLLGADAAARALDGYSTHRMFKTDCSFEHKRPTARLCNYEQFLPDFVSHHVSALYAFEGTTWFTQYLAVRFLVKHHHPRIARFIPLIDVLSTTSFAVNNLTLSVTEDCVDVPGQLASNPPRLSNGH